MTRSLLRAVFLCLLICLAGCYPVRGAADGDGFAQGNILYAVGDFAGASRAYETQVRRGPYTANLFYNLADAYYRQGQRGRAILNYRRALILDPGHAEAAANLAFVRGGKPVSPTGTGWVPATLPWLTAGAGWLAVAGLVLVWSGRRRRFVGFLLLGTGLLAVVAGVAVGWSLDDGPGNAPQAVVVADGVPALYAPAENSKVVTNLTAGGDVRVLSDQGAWVYALLSDGTRAWVAADKIERVVPP